jgi:general L-amino acid transport system substrate-binding protein
MLSIAFGLLGAITAAATASAQATLNTVKQRGMLVCGSNTGLAGFGLPDAQGNWTGLDVDLCRAIAAAIFDDPKKVRFIPLSAKDRFTALQSGEALGLTNDWAVRIIKQVGNYGEVFEKNVGSGSRLGIARGLNNLWNKGGIQYAPPIR